MKKYLLLSFFALSVSQCHAIENLQQAQEQLAAIKQAVQRNGLTDNTLNSLHSTIDQIAVYAIKNSKTIIGQQDMGLIGAATVIRDINDDIFKALKTENINVKKEKIHSLLTSMTSALKNADSTIKREYTTRSKQDAQKVLREIIAFFIEIIPNQLEQELGIIDFSEFK